jgi:hypothetical protein
MSPLDTNLAIVQGVQEAQRVGNRIKVKKATFKAVFVPSGYNVSTNPIPEPVHVKLCLFYEKAKPTTQPVPVSNMFELGAGQYAIQGELSDMVAPFNKDRYVVVATKTFKLGFQQYFGTGNQPASQQWSNNDFKLNQLINWDFTKHLVKLVKYNDNATLPITRGLWMQVMVAPASGQPGLSGVIPATMQYWNDLHYEDA